jgi:beta-carotene 3-hydroxylase
MTVILPLMIVLATVAAMEGLAWAAHKYIMHGFGWAWHRDHHEPHDNVVEKNDLFGLIGAVATVTLFILGYLYSPVLWWVALGVTLYGIIYALVHDGLVHQRFFRWVPKSGYARWLVQAHKLHHAAVGKDGGVSFGFVFVRNPARLTRDLKAQREAGQVKLRGALER